MSEQGRYEKTPRPESIDALVRYLRATKAVRAVLREGSALIVVRRDTGPALRTFMTNIYIVSLADVHEIFADAGEVEAIVTMSAWNGYTVEAKALCKEKGVGLFTFKEFLGAVHYAGDRFLDYIPPEKREQSGHRKRSG